MNLEWAAEQNEQRRPQWAPLFGNGLLCEGGAVSRGLVCTAAIILHPP